VEEQEAVEDINTEYASVYFQRDDVPLWCIKHRICFTCLDSDAPHESIEEPIKIEK
jgi:hypothetical protein